MYNTIEDIIFNAPPSEELIIKEDLLYVRVEIWLSTLEDGVVRIVCKKAERVCGCDSVDRDIEGCKCEAPEECYIRHKCNNTESTFITYNHKREMIFPLDTKNRNITPQRGFLKHILGGKGGVAIGFYSKEWILKSIYFPYISNKCHFNSSKICRDVVFNNILFRYSTKKEFFLVKKGG